VSLYYLRNIHWLHAGVPDIVGVDKHDRTFLVAAGADVAEHGGRRYAVQLHLFPEYLEQFAATLRAAATLTRRGANEDLTQLAHAQILCRGQEKSRGGAQPGRFANLPYGQTALEAGHRQAGLGALLDAAGRARLLRPLGDCFGDGGGDPLVEDRGDDVVL